MSIRETLAAIDGALSGRPRRWLSPGVRLEEPEACAVGADAVADRLRSLGHKENVVLTLDEGRGVAEWDSEEARMACAFEIHGGLITRARLYACTVRPLEGR